MTSHDERDRIPTELSELLQALRPKLARICSNHCLSAEASGRVIYECALDLVREWHGLHVDRGEYLVEMVKRACHREASAECKQEEN
jgi:hypothetical protein